MVVWVDGVGVISEVFWVLWDGVWLNLVKFGDLLVEFWVGWVVWILDSFVIVGGFCVGIVLFLFLVDDGDICGLLVNYFE